MATVSAVPQGMHTVTPVLTLKGCAEALELYKKAFGAEEIARVPDPSGKLIWHAMIRIGDSTIFLSDEIPGMGNAARPSQLWLYGEGVDNAFKRATSAGCKALMPPTDMFWGDRFGRLIDPFGHHWGLATHKEDVSPAEMKKRSAAAMAQMGQPA